MSTVTRIRIARQDETLWDGWQGDISDIDTDASQRAYDAALIDRLQQAYPGADIDTDYQLSYQSGMSATIDVDGDDERGTAEDEARQVIEQAGIALAEDPDPWLVLAVE